MFEEKKRIKSDHLKGIVKLHEDHRGVATMNSTGQAILVFEDETNPRYWQVEFKCEVCGELVHAWYADINDLIRLALKDNGILKA